MYSASIPSQNARERGGPPVMNFTALAAVDKASFSFVGEVFAAST
jgi:hypothetical protein